MIIAIDCNTTIADVQQQFTKQFPFLKIEFTHHTYGFGEYVPGRFYHQSFPLQSIAQNWQEASLELQPWYETGDVETLFEQTFGLHVQILRYDNGRWIQTAGTDLLSLNEQNEIGRQHAAHGGFSITEKENLL